MASSSSVVGTGDILWFLADSRPSTGRDSTRRPDREVGFKRARAKKYSWKEFREQTSRGPERV
jgi:hypothetical protein